MSSHFLSKPVQRFAKSLARVFLRLQPRRLDLDEEELAELQLALTASDRQIPSPARTSEPPLGNFTSLQARLIGLALKLKEAPQM